MKTLSILALTFALTLSAFAAPPVSLPEVNSLIDKIGVTPKPQAELEADPAFIRLSEICTGNSVAVTDALPGVSNGDAGASLVIRAMQSLPAAEYMTMLEKLPVLVKQRQIGVPVLASAISPQGRMTAFLPDNYQNPRVVAFVAAARPSFAGTPSDGMLGALSAGLVTKAFDAHRAKGTPIPKVLLP